jgi:hypothetical protein
LAVLAVSTLRLGDRVAGSDVEAACSFCRGHCFSVLLDMRQMCYVGHDCTGTLHSFVAEGACHVQYCSAVLWLHLCMLTRMAAKCNCTARKWELPGAGITSNAMKIRICVLGIPVVQCYNLSMRCRVVHNCCVCVCRGCTSARCNSIECVYTAPAYASASR